MRNSAKPNRGVVWCRSDDGKECRPFYKYGSGDGAEYFHIPDHYWPVWRTDYDETRTPYHERGRLSEDGTKLYY
jgi:hypothetical protein